MKYPHIPEEGYIETEHYIISKTIGFSTIKIKNYAK